MRAGDKQKVAGDNQGCEDNSSNINSISCELNDAMDIDALIDSGHKRRKTSARATRINPSNELEGSGALLEHRQKRRADRRRPVAVVTSIHFSPVHGFLCFQSFWVCLDSFVAIWKGELFVNEREGSSTTDMAPYAIGDVMNLVPPSVTRGVIVASSVVEGVALVNADQGVGAGSFALTNCFGGRNSLLAILGFTAGSFALANCFEGRDSSPTNLNFTFGSFALANFFGVHDSSLANLDFTTKSFALANYFRGRGFSPTNLDFVDNNFVGMEFYS
ncbi:hypothetical protein PVK06_007613 [Gossypium arboreum]|uniref:Pentapeptide repeat-containing protein n=1 Tax=Gossypium arboreum TaxID=29729 RepID=A0ABR0QIY9_GOSAR|nr:hypothetical protein PVK06_007613 [Gossypium arboreum]